ncbi:MAG: Hsp20/alpha crystallin family protein [Rhodospirillales bacterium]|nr:Hsp20/alpha crystallin family protein [Alphaproteobacteria bacterium]USO03834.1 MAG: Hsp20/alpha crystallin family protein [Rhodospirillales bacterium]
MTLNEFIHWNRPSNVPVQRRSRFGHSLMSLQEDMDRLLHDFFGGTSLPAWAKEQAFPAVDIIEDGEIFKVKAELAGMNPDDVEISVTDGFLTLKGEKKEEKEEKDENYLRRETSYGSFQRTISLPETANCDKAEASFKNGVLSIEVPKKAGAIQKPKKLKIKKAA